MYFVLFSFFFKFQYLSPVFLNSTQLDALITFNLLNLFSCPRICDETVHPAVIVQAHPAVIVQALSMWRSQKEWEADSVECVCVEVLSLDWVCRP